MAEAIVGIDLAGPSNTLETAVVLFRSDDTGLEYVRDCEGTDAGIRDLVAREAARRRVVVGLDSPLSYEAGGGDRARDSALRKVVIKAGLHPGSVMPPTIFRMAYLTLRGLAVARFLEMPNVHVVEVHPGALLRSVVRPSRASAPFVRNPSAGRSSRLARRARSHGDRPSRSVHEPLVPRAPPHSERKSGLVERRDGSLTPSHRFIRTTSLAEDGRDLR